jgi:hypothetical protein
VKKGVEVKTQDSRRKIQDAKLKIFPPFPKGGLGGIPLVTHHLSLPYVLRLVSCVLILVISAFLGQKAVCASNTLWPDKTGWDFAPGISGDNSNNTSELEIAVSETPHESLVEVLQSIKRGIRPADRRDRRPFKVESKGSLADMIHGSPRGEPEAKTRLLSPKHRLFTPNGDGVNDTIEIRVSLGEMPSAEPELRIYDLTGYRIYSDQYPRRLGIDDNGSHIFSFTWDGDPPVNGRPDMASTGMYIYAIKAGSERFSGTITTISDKVRLGQ